MGRFATTPCDTGKCCVAMQTPLLLKIDLLDTQIAPYRYIRKRRIYLGKGGSRVIIQTTLGSLVNIRFDTLNTNQSSLMVASTSNLGIRFGAIGVLCLSFMFQVHCETRKRTADSYLFAQHIEYLPIAFAVARCRNIVNAKLYRHDAL